ncbi:AAA family ATPase [Candidatus Mesenet endosymbiont of Agriotes lineatus]|uniref:AAA family ATPase n=1 Tax=Candidatus Mesenet endosymbiont of Agriotes lineatus TaxID=3077948 RepID=UPI0030CC29C6
MDITCDLNNLSKNGHYKPLLEKEELKTQLLLNIRSCLSYLFRNGTFHGNEYRIGNLQGSKGKSLRIELTGNKAGLWNDFATGEGGDIIDLWAAAHRKDVKAEFHEVMASIGEWLGYYRQHKVNEAESTTSWDYLDENGEAIVKVYLYDTALGKRYLPFDVKKSSYTAPEIRPLYNIPGIIKADKVIIVEGEKCAESLIKQGITATTAMSGANAPIDKTDWSLLKGKHIIIWPDNDEPGKQYAEKVAKKLIDLGVISLAIIKVPQNKPKGWDAADCIQEGINPLEFITNKKSPYNNNNSSNKLKKIDTSIWTNTAPERKWIIKDWLPVGSVTALYGDGGVGKSLLAQQLMTAAAIGKPWLGIDIEQIKTYGVFCEYDEEELWRRQCTINAFYQLDMQSPAFLDNICLSSRVGENNLLMVFDNKGIGQLTPYFQELLADIELFQPKLVILDTAADLFGGNENDRSHVRQFIQNCCGHIAKTIKGAVLLCAHPSDSGIIRKTGTGGSTAWNNSVRSRWYLSKPDRADASDIDRVLCRKKSNYSASEQNQISFYWQNGAFVECDAHFNSERIVRNSYNKKLDLERGRRHDVILELIASEAYKGKVYTTAQFAKYFEGKLGLGSERSIRERISHLATIGHIKFFKRSPEHELSNTRSKYGYLCVEDMELKISEDQYVFIKPSCYLSATNGVLMPVENPDVWVTHNFIINDNFKLAE